MHFQIFSGSLSLLFCESEKAYLHSTCSLLHSAKMVYCRLHFLVTFSFAFVTEIKCTCYCEDNKITCFGSSNCSTDFFFRQDARQQREEAVEMARKEERRKYEEFIAEHKVCLCALTYTSNKERKRQGMRLIFNQSATRLEFGLFFEACARTRTRTDGHCSTEEGLSLKRLECT